MFHLRKGVCLHVHFVNTGTVLLSTSCATLPTWLRNVWGHASARRAFVVKKHIFIFLRKWLIVLLDKTLVPRLCRALWSCTETEIWTFIPLAPIEVHYMEKNAGMFSSKTYVFSTEERKTWASWMTWGWVQEIFTLEVNYSFDALFCMTIFLIPSSYPTPKLNNDLTNY